MSLREQRLVALAILVGLVAAVWLAVVSPILHGFDVRRERKATAREELSSDARLIASFGAARGDAERLRQAAGAYAFSAPNPAAAAELARDRLSKSVAAQGGVLQALRDQPTAAGRVRLQADLRISLPQLTALLRRLETDRPFATVDSLTVSAAEEGAGAPSAPLEVRLELTYSVR
ncbi:type II secretion system protein GspM [Caulobacter sp. S45]|uniref:type II secretion system protein GspM n=1 Tax=Caulobacter sp. S45 TaxID=1641861 RepID=UPI0015761426|nr:type II secretion system protein GspM [Caulobacter sp. S45]